MSEIPSPSKPSGEPRIRTEPKPPEEPETSPVGPTDPPASSGPTRPSRGLWGRITHPGFVDNTVSGTLAGIVSGLVLLLIGVLVLRPSNEPKSAEPVSGTADTVSIDSAPAALPKPVPPDPVESPGTQKDPAPITSNAGGSQRLPRSEPDPADSERNMASKPDTTPVGDVPIPLGVTNLPSFKEYASLSVIAEGICPPRRLPRGAAYHFDLKFKYIDLSEVSDVVYATHYQRDDRSMMYPHTLAFQRGMGYNINRFPMVAPSQPGEYDLEFGLFRLPDDLSAFYRRVCPIDVY